MEKLQIDIIVRRKVFVYHIHRFKGHLTVASSKGWFHTEGYILMIKFIVFPLFKFDVVALFRESNEKRKILNALATIIL